MMVIIETILHKYKVKSKTVANSFKSRIVLKYQDNQLVRYKMI